MKVFISWSKPRSHIVAEALHSWLKMIVQALDPWVSSEDIKRGKRWGFELAHSLDQCDFGIICLTRENLESPWILFEAGALAKNVDESRVCTYLLGLKPTDVKPPLGDFQATTADKDGTLRLISDINGALPDISRLQPQHIETLFETLWPRLEKELRRATELPDADHVKPERSDRSLLEEILQLLRMPDENQNPIQVLSSSAGAPIEVRGKNLLLADYHRIFPLGSLIKHPQFGFGRVLEMFVGGQHVRMKIHFYAVGERTLPLGVAQIERASEEGFFQSDALRPLRQDSALANSQEHEAGKDAGERRANHDGPNS